MKKYLLCICIFLFLLCFKVKAQSGQTVLTGQATKTITFPEGGCTYTWVNNTPGIGLPASGTGDIPSFKAVNTGNVPVTATITATPVPSDYAYITNFGSSSVSVINIITNKVVNTIPVGVNPLGVAVSADGSYTYITNNGSGTVSVINNTTAKVIATIAVKNPGGICVSPDGSRLYVSSTLGVAVINTLTNLVIANISIPQGALGITASPDGSKVYVASNGTLTIINTATNTISNTIAGIFPYSLSLSPDGTILYTANSGTGMVSVINTATASIIATINLGNQQLQGIVVSPDGGHVFVTGTNQTNGSGTITEISTATNTVITTLNLASDLFGIAISPDGNNLYVPVDNSTGKVLVISTATNTITNTILVGKDPIAFGNFISSAKICNSAALQYTITVNPNPAINTGFATGTIFACAGTASVSPQVQQFTVSGSNLTGNIIATAPTGFEVSLTAGTGYGQNVMLTQVAGTVNNTTIYVRSAATAPTGGISGNVTLTSTGATNQTVAVTGTVNALPTVNTVANQQVNNGTATTAINFTGTGNTYNWVNDTPGIGLAASGTGNIAPFTAVNTGGSPLTATIAVTPSSSGYAYIANSGSNNVSVINTLTNTVALVIPVGLQPFGVSVSPDGSRVYVPNENSGTVSVINTTSNTVTATVTVGSFPISVTVSPDGNYVYVVNSGSNTVSVINAPTNAVVANIPVGVQSIGVAISPDGSRLYVSNATPNKVTVINTATNSVITTVPVGAFPDGIVVSPDGSKVYVVNSNGSSVSVINPATNTVQATITVGSQPYGIAVSPDGSRLYVANTLSNTVSVINTLTNLVVSTIPVGSRPYGVSLSPDGTLVYAVNSVDNTVDVISTATNAVLKVVPVGPDPGSFGNFIKGGQGCTGSPVKFTITVNPTSETPEISFTAPTGINSACEGTASVYPNIQQVLVSGANLSGVISLTAPNGFEISLSETTGFSNGLIITPMGGTVTNVPVYVRLAATANAGSNSGNVECTSPRSKTIEIPVTGTVNALPAINAVANQQFTNGAATTAIVFTGTANTFTWVNDTPGIGLAASGNGNIPVFTAVNTGNTPIIATITVTPESGNVSVTGTGCSGAPVQFTITVLPSSSPVITATGTLAPLTTVYGTPSTSDSFNVAATGLTAGILVTPPAGFELSTDDQTFNGTLNIGTSGALSPSNVYIRLAAITPVGEYSGNITLSSANAPNGIIFMPVSIVKPAPLLITANDVNKAYGSANPPLTASYTGFVNNETPADLTTQPELITTAITSSPVGQYPITVSGAASPNYSISYHQGTLTVNATPAQIAIPNTFTPNGDGINDTWDIKYLEYYPNCTLQVFNRWGQSVYSSIGYGIPWNGTFKGTNLPTGTYYYILNLKNGIRALSGFVAIVR